MTYSIGATMNADAISDTIVKASRQRPRGGPRRDLNKAMFTAKIAINVGQAAIVAGDP